MKALKMVYRNEILYMSADYLEQNLAATSGGRMLLNHLLSLGEMIDMQLVNISDFDEGILKGGGIVRIIDKFGESTR